MTSIWTDVPHSPLLSSLSLSLSVPSLDVFFRWLFDKKFLDDGTVRFE